jgi:outer membrane immunogenic protein
MTLRKVVWGAAAAFTLGAAATSASAGPGYRASEPWTGFYLGAQLGGAFSGESDVTYPNFPASTSSPKFGGVVGGGQLGFNKQFGGLVVGVEASITNGPRGAKPTPSGGETQSIDISPVVQVVGRVGYAWGPTLVYGLGGYAAGDVDERLQSNSSTNAVFDKQWHNGWVAGGGIEHLLHPNVVVGLEYRHVSLDDKVHVGTNNFGGDVPSRSHRVDADYDVVTARVSIKFGEDRREPMK